MKIWFVIYCKSHKDDVAESFLSGKGFEVYRPLLNDFNVKNKKRNKKVSLFPRYLFLNVDPEEQSLMSVKYTPGVLGFVKFGDNYAKVSDTVINGIKVCEAEQRRKKYGNFEFMKGESVHINGEGFSNIKATFFERHSDNRVVVLLKMLGGMSTMLVPSACVSRSSSY